MNIVTGLHEALRAEIAKVVVGQQDAVRLLLIALVCEGHVLIEGVPGVAKTTLARAVAAALGLAFGRVQFTPDLMPSDIVGTQIYAFQEGRFHFVEGPVFTNVLLADEINRAPAKTQSALLEAMQERQVSIDGKARPLPNPFLVLATQNPIEQQGTYPLPEAQLDRFLFKVSIGYPSVEDELAMLVQHAGDSAAASRLLSTIAPVAGDGALASAREAVSAVTIEPPVARYLVEIVRQTRASDRLQLGGSPRATLLLQAAARAAAALDGRDFVIPDDVKGLVVPVLGHRVVLTAAAEVEGADAPALLREIADSVPVPR
jgi:MoxR-like ATPase